MADVDTFAARLKVLHDAYAGQLPEKLRQIEQAWQALTAGEWDHESLVCLHRMAHSLSGSGQTFGFAELGSAARNLELALQPLIQEKTAPGADQRDSLRVLQDALRQAFATHAGP